MKRNWIRAVAVILSLCLILNSGFLDLAGYVYAAAGDSAPNAVQTLDAEQAGDSSNNDQNADNTTTENDEDSDTEPANDGSEVSDDSTDEGSGNSDGGSDTDAGEDAGNSNNSEAAGEGSTSSASTEGSTVGGTGEGSTDTGAGADSTEGADSNENGNDEAVTETESETGTEIETETETTEEETTEELTTEMVLEEGLTAFSTRDTGSAAENRLPDTVDEYLANKKSTYYIQNWADFIKVQEFCNSGQVGGFAGVTFIVSKPEDAGATSGIWNTAEMTATIGDTSYTFTGIGTSADPFKGEMYCAFYNGGVKFVLDRPLFSHLSDGANIHSINIEANGCCSPIAEYIDEGNITLSDLAISGTIGAGASTSAAGTIAGTLGTDSNVTISNVTSTASITGNSAGAVAGKVGSNAKINWPDGYVIGSEGAPITVTGSWAAGGLYGWASGDQTMDITWFDHVAVNVNGSDGFAGGLIGIVDGSQNNNAGADVTVTGGTSLAVNIGTTAGTVAGGLIGGAYNDVTLSFPADSTFTISGKIDGGTGRAGGVIGEIKDCRMTIKDVTIAEGTELKGAVVGGIVSYVSNEGTKMIIDTPTMSGTLKATSGVGGLLGQVAPGCAVELQGTVTVADKLSADSGIIGSIAATQDSALIYLHGIEGKVDGASQLAVPMTGSLPKYNDVYTYGGVFRNQDMGNGVLLIGTGDINDVGVVNNKITGGQLGEGGERDAAADLETFAIANFSNGKFGLVAEDGSSIFVGATTCAEILSASYVLNSNADISYEKTGIITLNRNDVADNASNVQYAFSGKLAGVSKDITITQNTDLFQWRMGLFSGLTGTPEFSNLIIDGNVTRSSYVGGLAYWIYGNGIKLTNVQMRKTMSGLGGSIGGFIVNEIGGNFTVEADYVTLGAKIDAGSIANFSGFINSMADATVDMSNITLAGSLKSFGSGDAGGFLGGVWTHVGGTIVNVSVESGTTYDTNAVCGALIHTVSSKAEGSVLTMDNVNLANLDVTLYKQGNSSLGIHNGQKLVLEMVDYNTAGVSVAGAAADFDEIMAFNVLEPSQKTFGVVSLHKRGSVFPDYHYENQADYENSDLPLKNADGRYYYDVFQNLDPTAIDSWATEQVVVSGNVIDSPAKYFVWHILQCCHGEAELRNTFKPYFENGDLPTNSNQTYTFSGDLNLSTYSIYPVPRQQLNTYNGVNNAKFTFAAEDMAGWTLSNIEASQHNMLHSGLFYSTYDGGPIIVDKITLAGSIACANDYTCGALVAGALNSGGTFTNITLDNLHIHDYKGSGASLLIGNIPDSTVIFDGIEMINYKVADYTTTKAAGSLIYAAGGDNATNLVLKFHDMVIIEDREGLQAANPGTILKYSSFIYKYDYTDDASINEGSGLYLFSEGDEDAGRVTYGAELDEDTEYSDTENKVLENVTEDPANLWIPYIYKEKQILVNPKSGDVLKGCGTYEDPYIIETYKQFLTLYSYINEPELVANADGSLPDYKNQTLYEGWKLIKTGDDSTFCSTKHVAEVATSATDSTAIKKTVTVGGVTYSFTGTGAEDVVVFGEVDENGNDVFPTPDELSRAYYQLGEDINLSGITNSTYSIIAEDFVGFGTLERPFTGVWYGKDDEDGTVHTITLPDKATDAIYTTYGLIQYAQGAVVKDLIIESPYNEAGTARLQTQINSTYDSAGGSVIACILGGDNIIDGVTANVHLQNTNGNASVGGYVGVVRKGGLILRNMTDTSLKNYTFTLSGTGDWNRGLYGAVVGKVEDGYVIYEGDSSDSYLYEGKGGNTLTYTHGDSNEYTSDYAQVGNYQILNGDKLKADAAGFSVTVSDTAGGTSEKDITITIPSAAGLQVMSMALNANAFNVMPSDDTAYASGYTELSRSRKAAYDKIGACASATEADYVKAAAYDNANGYANGTYSAEKAYAYPYLYQYMGIEGAEYLDFVNGEYSILNTSDKVNGTTYHMYWKLAENGTYDMRVFNAGTFDSFRGIGGLYYPANVVGNVAGSSFKGDFDGNGSTILIDMERRWIVAEDWEVSPDIKRVGLFNAFYAPTRDSELKGIYNHLEDLGNTDATAATRPCFKISNFAIGGTIEVNPAVKTNNTAYAGGVVAEVVTGNYMFEKISAAESTPLVIGSTNSSKISSAGGITGRVGINWNQTTSRILIQNCNWISTGTDITVKSNSHTGGFVGESSAKVLQIKDSGMDNLTVKSNGGHAGGFVGQINDSAGKLILTATAEDKTFVKNSSITGWEKAGGMVGDASVAVEIRNVLSQGNAISSYNHMGGVVGHMNGDRISNIYNVNVKDIVTYELDAYNGKVSGIGGVIGKNEHTLLIQDALVTDSNTTDDTYSCQIQAIEKNRTGAVGVGGIVGHTMSKPLTLRDCEVKDVYIRAEGKFYRRDDTVHQHALMAGGLVGFVENEIMLDGIVKTSGLYVEAPQQKELAVSAEGLDLSSSDYRLVGAGGCFGRIKSSLVSGYRTNTWVTYYKGLATENNTIRGKNAGGICGYVDSGQLRLHGAKVTGGDIYGDSTAGGIFGYAIPNTDGIALNEVQSYASTAEEDINIVSGVKIIGCMAGGAIGHANISAARMRIENITIENCDIHARKLVGWSKDSAGGLMGAVTFATGKQIAAYGVTIDGNTIVCENEGNTIAEGKIIYPAAGGLVGRSFDNSKAGAFFCDFLTIKENNQIGMLAVTTEEDGTITYADSTPKLIQWNETDSVFELVDVVLPENVVLGDLQIEGTEWKNYDALDSLVQKYGYCVGSVIGVDDSELVEFYIWRSKDENNLFNNPVMSVNPPVTDVGFNETAEITEDSGQYWRDTVHIVYGAPVTAVTETIAATEDTEAQSVTYQSSDPAANLAYMKMRVDEANTAYDKSQMTFESLFTSYRLSKEDVDLFNASYQETYGFPGTAYEITEPILVLKTENGTVQESMERITNIMTNMAGNSATDIDGSVLTIETKQKVVNNSVITDGTGTPSIKAAIEDSVVTYTSADYDSITEEGLTFTEITFTYQMPDSSYHQKVFKLNIFVEEPVLYGVHMMIKEGNVTSVADIKEKKENKANGILANAAIQIANDSDYTLLMEYTYGKARTKMPDNVITEKYFYLRAENELKEIPVGTKLRLIDVTHGNTPYYYEVKATGVTKLAFSDFTDSAGNPYENQPINELVTETDADQIYYSDLAADAQETEEVKALHQLEETGVERYLLTVMNENKGNQLYTIHTDMEPQIKNGTEEQNEGVASQFSPAESHEEMPYFTVTAVPGLVIQLEKEDGKTDITGKITKEDSLSIKATFSLTAEDQLYWQLLGSSNNLDSENSGKYLELAFYLRDGSTRVNLPDGTNFSYLLKDGTYSENKVIQNNSIVYYYKDIRTLFEQADAEYKINNLTGNTEVTVEFNLNFAGADLSEFTSGSYMAYIELLRTADRDYPMGSGNSLDIYSKEVEAQAVSNLGFAIQAIDLTQLAINTYPAPSEDGDIIDYQTMFDFSDILEKISGEGEEEALARWAGFDYEVTYELWKKTENGENVTYERYTGNDTAEGTGDSIVINVTDADGEKTSSGGAVTATYNFTASEIENGSEGQAGLIIRDGQMTIATKDLVAASYENLTNYKIIATMKIRESEETSADDENATKDFFVFTVTKLKTDLSE